MLRVAIALSLLSACALDLDTDEDEGEVALQPFHGRFGSPTIVRDDSVLHAYFPRQRQGGKDVHVAHARSLDGGASWDFVGDAVPKLNKLAKQDGSVWAPGAAKIDDDHWMVYYTAVRTGTEQKMCTYRAHASGPRGPFVDDYAGPLICPEGSLWAIDPYPVRDAHGDWHLLARVDEPNGNNTLKIRKLGEFGQHFAPDSDWVELAHINKGGWEEPVMENAAMVRLRVGKDMRWFMFYSGGSFRNNTYAVGYADCGASIHGPCVKKTVAKPWMDSDPDLHMFGPGTPSFFRDEDGRAIMAVNTWKFPGGSENPKNKGQQVMHMFEVHVNLGGRPVARFLRMVE
jgi:Glycosyl hydrolases family 43